MYHRFHFVTQCIISNNDRTVGASPPLDPLVDLLFDQFFDIFVVTLSIGVGAQSTLWGGKTFLHEKYV